MKKLLFLLAIIALSACAKTKPLATSNLSARNIDTIVKLKPRHIIKLAKIDAKVRIAEAKEETKQDKQDVKRTKIESRYKVKDAKIAVKQSKVDNKHDVAIKKQDTKQAKQATKIATANKLPKILMWISIMVGVIVIGVIVVFLLVRRR